MRNYFLITLYSIFLLPSAVSQSKLVFHDENAGIKCSVYDFKCYYMIDIQNQNKCPIYVPDIFSLIGDFELTDSYFTNDLSQYPFLNNVVPIKKIKEHESRGFLVEGYYEAKNVQVLLGYSKKEILSDKVINFVDMLDYKLISQSEK